MNPSAATAYLDRVKRAVTGYETLGGGISFEEFDCSVHYDLAESHWKIALEDRPLTLLSKGQLDLIERAILQVEAAQVPGDLIEAGVWRGGAVVLMRAVLAAQGIAGRNVVAADSFAGIPQSTRFAADPVNKWSDRWEASLDDVRTNIAQHGFLDERTRFLPGFFEDTLPALTDERFALIRLDSDAYDSVRCSLEQLYPLLAPGGIIIIDDWHLLSCRMAVQNYRMLHQLGGKLTVTSGNAWWVKQEPYAVPARP
jgi:O-methyltransferase